MVVARLFAEDGCESVSCRSSSTAETLTDLTFKSKHSSGVSSRSSSSTAETLTDLTFKSKHSSGATTPRGEGAALQSAQLAELKKMMPLEEMHHLPRVERLIARVREMEMQSANTFCEDGHGKVADDDPQVDAQAAKIANLEKQVAYYSERCGQLEGILFEEGRTSQFHSAVYKLLSATHSDGKNIQRSLSDQAAVINQLQDVVHNLSNQLDAEKDRTRSLTAQLVTAAKESPPVERKLEQPARFYTTGTGADDYAQRVVDAAVKGSVGSSLEVVMEQTPDRSVRQDLNRRLRGISVDTARATASGPGTQRGSPCSTQRSSPRAVTPRASRREPATDPKRAGLGAQGQHPSKPGTPLLTPRMLHRSPALSARGLGPAVSTASNVVWAPEPRRTLIGGG